MNWNGRMDYGILKKGLKTCSIGLALIQFYWVAISVPTNLLIPSSELVGIKGHMHVKV